MANNRTYNLIAQQDLINLEFDNLIKKADKTIFILESLECPERLDPALDTVHRHNKRHFKFLCFFVIIMGFNIIRIINNEPDEFSFSRKCLYYFVSILAIVVNSILAYSHIRDTKRSSNNTLLRNLYRLSSEEREKVSDTIQCCEINPSEVKLADAIKIIENKRKELIDKKNHGPCKVAFLMGLHPRLGAKSSIHSLSTVNKDHFDENSLRLIFELLGYSDASLKQKTDHIRPLLETCIFFREEYSENDDRIAEITLRYLELNPVRINNSNYLVNQEKKHSALSYQSTFFPNVAPSASIDNENDVKELLDNAKNTGNRDAQKIWDKKWGLIVR